MAFPIRVVDHGGGLITADSTLRFPGNIRLPARATMLKLEDGSALLLSPLPRLRDAVDEVKRHGPIRAILAPNLMHNLGLKRAKELFPDAPVFGPPGLEKKDIGVALDGALHDEPDARWAGEVEQHFIRGLKDRVGEVAFFHRASRTLVLTDLCFHLTEVDHFPTRLVMRLNNAYGRFGPSRLIRSQFADRRALRQSIDHLLAWDPERIVVAHGDVVERDGRAKLEEAFAFLSR